MSLNPHAPCPCCSEKPYIDCCLPGIEDHQCIKTPLALMRSRFTAFATKNDAHLKKTALGQALKEMGATPSFAPDIQWTHLTILDASKNTVTFIAEYLHQGQLQKMQEYSLFKKHQGKWFYISSLSPMPSKKSPCPCHSGKRFKSCCGNTLTKNTI